MVSMKTTPTLSTYLTCVVTLLVNRTTPFMVLSNVSENPKILCWSTSFTLLTPSVLDFCNDFWGAWLPFGPLPDGPKLAL